MERFFILDKYNTFIDWSLILTKKSAPQPKVKTNYINLDGVSGTLDMSEALTGEVAYDDRTVSATFWTDKGNRSSRAKLIRDITTKLHGKKVKIIDPDYPTQYYYGRVEVGEPNNTASYMEFTITATCDPWRYSLNEAVRLCTVSGSDVDLIIVNNGFKTLCPDITVNGAVTITLGDVATALTNGSYKVTNLRLKAGSNVLNISGSGTVTLRYREADL